MKLIVSDIEKDQLKLTGSYTLIDVKDTAKNCIGCFGCWVKTPGACVIKDDYQDMGKLMGACDELIVISECVYGTVSPEVKNIVDRSISYIHPYFVSRNGEMHHKRRYPNKIKFSAYFYGDEVSTEEKDTAIKHIRAMGVNFDATIGQICFYHKSEEIGGISL